MQTVSFPEFLTLSLLGIRWEGKVTEDPITHVATPKQSKITYHLEFLGEQWFYYYEGERAEDVVKYFCEKFNLISEYVGDNAWILRETILGKVQKETNLLRARARSVRGISKMLSKHEQRMSDWDRKEPTGNEKVCADYREAYAQMVAFGQTFVGHELDLSHTRTCQACRFWKAEHDRKIKKVNSKPGVQIDEVA